ncbi:transcriptional regulator [Belliella baltica DSM 15883]|uniref:Transcriptional regulator n=1 Tax=Belliella baltica (strain DSM 15883 / CIP 108006 / LMG 21964 / BA134) TaxID=866536 RepID=I3Z6F4_BELBD|nr:LacI family DNA-binding transcriptional regulator [Belliella baltica]AFL84822.1 transcriptional regulator [Belliella baltica DSM 15883]
MVRKKTSIKDIAKALGVSITTISFIINGKAEEKRISKEMVKKVEDYVAKVGYRPNHLAQSLRSGKSKVLVLMVEDISNSFFSNIARLIEEKAFKNDYKIIYCSTENSTEKAKELIHTFKSRNVDGFIITPTADLKFEIENLIKENFGVILFDRWIPGLDCSHVIVENRRSSFEATQHLIDTGAKKIIFITVSSDQTQMQDRLKGYLEALELANLSPFVFEEPFHSSSEEFMGDQIKEFLLNHPDADALFFATNYLAFEGLHAIRKLELRIPEDLQVLAFDDHFFFSLYQPSISAIAQPLEGIAEKLMEGILNQLDENIESKTFKVELANQFVPRKSTFSKS